MNTVHTIMGSHDPHLINPWFGNNYGRPHHVLYCEISGEQYLYKVTMTTTFYLMHTSPHSIIPLNCNLAKTSKPCALHVEHILEDDDWSGVCSLKVHFPKPYIINNTYNTLDTEMHDITKHVYFLRTADINKPVLVQLELVLYVTHTTHAYHLK